MRVAFVVPFLRAPSGWRSASLGIIRSLHRYCGVEPVIVVSRADADAARSLLPDYDQIVLPEIQNMALDSPSSWARLLHTLWLVRTKHFPPLDIVHSLEAYPAGIVGHWVASRLKVPHVVTVHGTYGVIWSTFVLDRAIYKKVLKAASVVCPVSSGTANMLSRHFSDVVKKVRIQPVLEGNDYWRRVPRDVAYQRQFPKIPTILSVGAVKPRKGYHVSLAAFAKVKKTLPTARYLIVGRYMQGEYFERLQRLIEEYHIRDVEFLGEVSSEDLHQYYQQSSVFLLTPQQVGLQFEGFGLVYLEAGAYGLPVVGTRTGGVPDAVKDGVTGFLAEPHDVDSISELLLRLLTDVDLARQMGQANREWAETLTWERYAHEQYRIYSNILSETLQ